MDGFLSHLRPYTPVDSVDHNVEQSPTPVRRSQRYIKPPEIFTFYKNIVIVFLEGQQRQL